MSKWAPLLCLALVGCARFPAGGGGTGSKRLIITMTVSRQINTNYIYMVALRPTNELNPTDNGPEPVIAAPWGNGFVAGNCNYFVWWNPLTFPKYQIYKFADVNLTQYFSIGAPVAFTDVLSGANTIQFQIDLTQIAATQAEADAYQSLQVNFLTMDRIPQGDTGGSKAWDALGNGALPTEINTWITIPLNAPGIYNNARFNQIEPQGDAPDPDLDITDFSVELRSQ